MAKVLVKFEKDWADEFDVRGFAVYDKEEWEKDLAEFKECTEFGGAWFGTNEGWEGSEILGNKEDWVRSWEVTEISDDEAAVLGKFFGYPYVGPCFGTFKGPKELVGE